MVSGLPRDRGRHFPLGGQRRRNLPSRPFGRRGARACQGPCGWADVGVCLRLVSEQAALTFLHVRNEAYDLCFPELLASDVRLRKLLELLRSQGLRALFDALPGYELSRTFESRSL
jgi:molybdate-binding protein